MNNVTLLGRLTKDLDAIQKGETTYCNFTLAVDDTSKRDSVDFINCVTFGKSAELLAKYCGKGRQLAIEGRISTSNHNKHTYTTVIANRITYLHNPNGNNSPSEASAPKVAPSTKQRRTKKTEDATDLPF